MTDLALRKRDRFRLSYTNYQLDKQYYLSIGGNKSFSLSFYQWKWYVLWWGHTVTCFRPNESIFVNLCRPEYV